LRPSLWRCSRSLRSSAQGPILVGLGVLVAIVSVEPNGTLRLRFDRMNRLVGAAVVVIVGCSLVAWLHR